MLALVTLRVPIGKATNTTVRCSQRPTAQSTTTPKKLKPHKPSPDFSRFPHAGGCRAKKIKGKFAYFGPRGDLQQALENRVPTVSVP